MKQFMIVGEPGDLHAHYVSWALRKAGYRTLFVNSSHGNCPTETTLYLDNEHDEFTCPNWDNAEAAWCRRLPKPPASDTSFGEDDGFTLAEGRRFARWLITLYEKSSIRWINPPTAALAAENKFLQLKRARSHRIAIPRTLITARPDRFRAFLKSEGTIVAKPLAGYSWEYASGETFTAFANVVDAARGAEISDEDVGECVTIYQERIEKAADVRMLIMGQDVFAYKIMQEGEQHLDFRIGFFQDDHLKYEPLFVPPLLRSKIIRFVGSMGVNFASADFALTAQGEFIFLDLNPNGQWLFIDTGAPAARVAQKFCSFFVKGGVDPAAEDLFPSFAEYLRSDEVKALEETFRQHIACEARLNNSWKEKQA
jgi:hypothetical protein